MSAAHNYSASKASKNESISKYRDLTAGTAQPAPGPPVQPPKSRSTWIGKDAPTPLFNQIMLLPPKQRSLEISELRKSAEAQRANVETAARAFVNLMKAHGVTAYEHGSWVQGIALPDSDCDISCPEDRDLRRTRQVLQREGRKLGLFIDQDISDWRILLEHEPTGVQLDVTQRAYVSDEPYWKGEHVSSVLKGAKDPVAFREAVLLVKLWVKKHSQQMKPKDGYPNTYTFLLLFIWFCTHRQPRPVLPVIGCYAAEVVPGRGVWKYWMENGKRGEEASVPPEILVAEFLLFLQSDLYGHEISFDRADRLYMADQRDNNSKTWQVFEPFTFDRKCSARMWMEKRRTIIGNARVDRALILNSSSPDSHSQSSSGPSAGPPTSMLVQGR